MAEVFALEISSNVSEFPYEKKYPSTLTLGELKAWSSHFARLYLMSNIVGAVAETIQIELHDAEGKFVASLSDNSKNLKELGVKDGMRLHAVDVSGGNTELQDDTMVEKFTISEEEYNQREDSVRAWKKKLLAQSGAQHEVGERCEVRVRGAMSRRGVVSFVGETKFREGLWVGVTYDEPVGKNDGAVAGTRYFQCADKHGGFVRATDVVVGDFPPLPIEDDMDEI
ncbi:unnamed protein product [Nippostrongylus brasiliensis]|uniref:Tubulin-specific chaperone B (inferred by orthology to a C. elegans protein) n=1 Tax=Nippostrongylus brasiliensis TaxID=27835 RepID=A0A0N4YAD2_NIPBR|nr:unnamed protein product [Nippostrongylus brasiliensis]